MKLLRAWLGALPGYLWSGWGAIASLLLGMALWEALAAWYGPLVLPTPLETAQMLLQLMQGHGAEALWPQLGTGAAIQGASSLPRRAGGTGPPGGPQLQRRHSESTRSVPSHRYCDHDRIPEQFSMQELFWALPFITAETQWPGCWFQHPCGIE